MASAHCVTVGTLLAEEVAPIIGKPYLTGRTMATVSSPFLVTAKAMNGFGVTASDWTNAMQRLTSRQGLCFLTMLPWKELIAKSKLLRKVRAWCPACYQEWHQAESPIYDPLLWSLSPITVCIKHNRFLLYQCVHCNKPIPILGRKSRPGFCSHCNQWLGSNSDANETLTDIQLRWQTWVFEHLGTILATVPLLPSLPKRSAVADLVSACVRTATRGHLGAFLRKFSSFSYTTMITWRQGEALPELGRLMELCYQTDVSMKDVLLGKISPDSSLSGIVQDRKSISRYMTTDELEKMESVLHLMLNENPPVSLSEAARCLARHSRTIKKHFPELFLALKERRSTYESERLDRDKIKSFLLAAIDETPPPSLRSIATQLGCSCGVLRYNFPEEATSIVERYAETRKVFVDPESVRIKFQALQTEVPPLSIAQCAERLGCAPVHLYKYFPDVCRLIGSS